MLSLSFSLSLSLIPKVFSRFYCVVLALFIITEFFIFSNIFFFPRFRLLATSKCLFRANEIKRYMKNIKARLKVESFELWFLWKPPSEILRRCLRPPLFSDVKQTSLSSWILSAMMLLHSNRLVSSADVYRGGKVMRNHKFNVVFFLSFVLLFSLALLYV